jgi:HK97 gp10 family phage protein
MAGISMYIGGGRELMSFLNRLEKEQEKAIKTGLTAIAFLIERESKELIRTGYYRPAIDTGTMRQSFDHEVRMQGSWIWDVEVGNTVYYAFYVHEGVEYMPPRRFLTDSQKNKERDIIQIFTEMYLQALNKSK